jgi:hypothetical protein
MKPPGKKVGVLRVDLQREGARHDQKSVEVELRLSVQSGTFHARYEGQWYEARTKDELADQIRQIASKTADLSWTRYLVVEYTARAYPLDGDSGRPAGGRHRTLELDEDRATLAQDTEAEAWSDRASAHVITSVDLHWRVCELSDPYPLPEDKRKKVRMRREVDSQLADREEEGKETYQEVVGDPSEQDDDLLPAGAVPWTAEREALLREVLAMLGQLDARMVELFRGGPDELARRLDAAAQPGSARLLSALGPTPASPAPDGGPRSSGSAAPSAKPFRPTHEIRLSNEEGGRIKFEVMLDEHGLAWQEEQWRDRKPGVLGPSWTRYHGKWQWRGTSVRSRLPDGYTSFKAVSL